MFLMAFSYTFFYFCTVQNGVITCKTKYNVEEKKAYDAICL